MNNASKRLALIVTLGLLFLAATTIALWLLPASVWAQGGGTIYVAPAGSDGPTCGPLAAPCRTVKYAVESRAQPGSHVLAATGTYTDPFTVTVPGLTVEGAGRESRISAGHLWQPMVTFAPGLTATTVFSGFAVQNTMAGSSSFIPTSTTSILVDGSAPTLQNLWVQGGLGAGIWTKGAASPTLRGSVICANNGFQAQNDGSGAVEAAGNWWGTNTPLAGETYTGTVTITPPISVSLALWQPPLGTGSLGSWSGSGSFALNSPATVTVLMNGGGFTPPPGMVILLKAEGGHFADSGGPTINLTLVGGAAQTTFVPTTTHGVFIAAFDTGCSNQAIAGLDYRYHVFLPIVMKNYPPPPPTPPAPTCPATSNASFDLLSTLGAPIDHPDYLHGDLNLSLRGYDPYTAPDETTGFIDYNGATASDPPQLSQLTTFYANNPFPGFAALYQVYGWIWNPTANPNICGGNPDGCVGPIMTYNPAEGRYWDITMTGLTTTPGEKVYLPTRSAELDPALHAKALVLYAEETRLTLGYTRDDTIANGYAVHLENVCVDPNLLALYRAQVNPDGTRKTGNLPALSNGQSLGTALADEMQVVIRDRGAFMDPRSRKDWWQGVSSQASLPIMVRNIPEH